MRLLHHLALLLVAATAAALDWAAFLARTYLAIATGSKWLTSRIDFLPFSTTIENVRAHFLAMMLPPAPRAHTPCGM
jgi:hypothetical protein